VIAPPFAIAAPPDSKDTVGREITSFAVIDIMTSCPTLACVVGPGELFEAILTTWRAWAVLSNVTALESSTVVSATPEIPARLLKATLKVILPSVSPALAV